MGVIMKIHDAPIYGEIRHHAESLRRIETVTSVEQWAGLKGIYLLYQDIHELGHHNEGQEEKDADIFALQIMQTYIGGMSFAFEHDQPLADACRELGIPVTISNE